MFESCIYWACLGWQSLFLILQTNSPVVFPTTTNKHNYFLSICLFVIFCPLKNLRFFINCFLWPPCFGFVELSESVGLYFAPTTEDYFSRFCIFLSPTSGSCWCIWKSPVCEGYRSLRHWYLSPCMFSMFLLG